MRIQFAWQKLPESRKLKDENGSGSWKLDGGYTITLDWPASDNQPAQSISVQVLASWDWELGRQTLVFTGGNADGESVWGKKLANS
ncbi:lipocalin-like domain-containing protein [Paenibacillus solisilvae]|uniref:Lipocalin-like domain-containing protein n=1 Tax=Paenibacillus solisilvae TaxID=2486751 RepID=A0ABW0VYP7_9BACL